MKRKRRFVTVAASMAVLLALSACGSTDSQSTDAMTEESGMAETETAGFEDAEG